MMPGGDEARQGDASQAHSAHEGAEQNTQGNRGGTDHELQELAPNDFVNERGTTAGGKQEQEQRQKPLDRRNARRFRGILSDHIGPDAGE
jgi:hypothetical protein